MNDRSQVRPQNCASQPFCVLENSKMTISIIWLRNHIYICSIIHKSTTLGTFFESKGCGVLFWEKHKEILMINKDNMALLLLCLSRSLFKNACFLLILINNYPWNCSSDLKFSFHPIACVNLQKQSMFSSLKI